MSLDDCPRCGCNAWHLVRAGTRWGDRVEHRRCDHCSFRWQVTTTTEEIPAPQPAEIAPALPPRQGRFVAQPGASIERPSRGR